MTRHQTKKAFDFETLAKDFEQLANRVTGFSNQCVPGILMELSVLKKSAERLSRIGGINTNLDGDNVTINTISEIELRKIHDTWEILDELREEISNFVDIHITFNTDNISSSITAQHA